MYIEINSKDRAKFLQKPRADYHTKKYFFKHRLVLFGEIQPDICEIEMTLMIKDKEHH